MKNATIQRYHNLMDALNIIRASARNMDARNVDAFLQLLRIQNYLIQEYGFSRGRKEFKSYFLL